MRILLIIGSALLLGACTNIPTAQSTSNQACYDRQTMGYNFKVDSHLHFQPFGGEPIPHTQMMTYLNDLGIEHANMYGIGQTLPYNSSCSYYLNCPGTPVTPSMQNDFLNAKQSLLPTDSATKLTLSMTFLDLSKPDDIVDKIHLLDQEFPGLYRWTGEVNLVKQAVFANGQPAITEKQIEGWISFMPTLKERDIPLGLHGDLGNDANPTQYLHLMQKVLASYPDNKIIWLHMGLSKELSNIDPDRHIAILQQLLDQYPYLMLDLSWRVIYDEYFKYPKKRAKYVTFINKNYSRFLTGTDFVASDNETFESYKTEVEVTSYINQFLDDNTFRHVALGMNYYQLLGVDKRVEEICSN